MSSGIESCWWGRAPCSIVQDMSDETRSSQNELTFSRRTLLVIVLVAVPLLSVAIVASLWSGERIGAVVFAILFVLLLFGFWQAWCSRILFSSTELTEVGPFNRKKVLFEDIRSITYWSGSDARGGPTLIFRGTDPNNPLMILSMVGIEPTEGVERLLDKIITSNSSVELARSELAF